MFKITKPPKFGAMWELGKYLQNLIWSNELFDDDIRIEGVIQTLDGVSLVISQPYIRGIQPKEEHIAEWFEIQGFKRLSPLVWERQDGCRIADAHTGNFILAGQQHLVPIDLHVERFSADQRL